MNLMKSADGESRCVSKSILSCLTRTLLAMLKQHRRCNGLRVTCCSIYKEFEDKEDKGMCQFYYAHVSDDVLKTVV